jgi:hypothetical protein
MTKFSVTQNGNPISKKLYNWDEKTKTFSTKEEGLVLDFIDIDGVTFNTGHSCTFNTGSNCTFKTDNYCTFYTGSNCTFNAGSNCAFDTGHYCTFKTGSYCTFDTGPDCTFRTGYDCTFNTGSDCTFKTNYYCTFDVGENCSLIRSDVKGVTEIPDNKKIELNDSGMAGYIFVGEKKEIPTCNGKAVEIDGKKYKLVEVKE